MSSRIKRLERLDELRRSGAITAAEFELLKAKVIASVWTTADYESSERASPHYDSRLSTVLQANLARRFKAILSELQTKLILLVAIILLISIVCLLLLRRSSNQEGNVYARSSQPSALRVIGPEPTSFVEGDAQSTAALALAALFDQGAMCHATRSLGATTDIYEIDGKNRQLKALADGTQPDRLFGFEVLADQLSLKPVSSYEMNVNFVRFESIRTEGDVYKLSGQIDDVAVSKVVFSCKIY